MSSLDNGLRILALIDEETTILRVTDVADALELPKATVSRTLKALCDAELLERAPTGTGYVVGRRVVDMSRHYFSRHSCLDEVDALLRDLVQRFGFTGHAGTVERGDRLLLIARQGWYPLQHAARVGERKFVFDSIIGQAILARGSDADCFALLGLKRPDRRVHGLDQAQVTQTLEYIRRYGYAQAESLKTPGISSIGSAVADPNSKEVVGFCLSFPSQAASETMRQDIAADVLSRAMALGRRLDDPFWVQFRPEL